MGECSQRWASSTRSRSQTSSSNAQRSITCTVSLALRTAGGVSRLLTLLSRSDVRSLSLEDAHLAITGGSIQFASLTHLSLENCLLWDAARNEYLADILTPTHLPALTSFTSRLLGREFTSFCDRRPPGFDALAAQLESVTFEEDYRAWLGVADEGLWSRMVKLKELTIMEPTGLSTPVLVALRSLPAPLRRLDLTAGDDRQYSKALESLAVAWRQGWVSVTALETVVLRGKQEGVEVEMVNAMKGRGVVVEWV